MKNEEAQNDTSTASGSAGPTLARGKIERPNVDGNLFHMFSTLFPRENSISYMMNHQCNLGTQSFCRWQWKQTGQHGDPASGCSQC